VRDDDGTDPVFGEHREKVPHLVSEVMMRPA
jgi:hypothetical protein